MRWAWTAVLVASTSLVAPALADAPPGRYLVSAATVRDTKTSLVWMRAVITAADGMNVPSLEEARKLCVLPWRLPALKELATLIDESAPAPPFVDASAFPGTPNLPLWSSTVSNAVPEDFRSYVMNSDGTFVLVYYNGGGFSGAVVRCVQ